MISLTTSVSYYTITLLSCLFFISTHGFFQPIPILNHHHSGNVNMIGNGCSVIGARSRVNHVFPFPFPFPFPLQVLFMNKKKNSHYNNSNHNSNIKIDEIEKSAIIASENWDISVTPFLNESELINLQSRLDNRADVGYIPIGNIFTSTSSATPSATTSRTRLVMTNPDLVLDGNEIEKQYCSMLRIDHLHTSYIMDSSSTSSMSSLSSSSSSSSTSTSTTTISTSTKKSKPWPQLFLKIGIELSNVGEVVIESENDCAYIILSKDVVKQCQRLLPKELRGVGISICEMDVGEYIPYDGVHQDMELGVLDKRLLQYK